MSSDFSIGDRAYRLGAKDYFGNEKEAYLVEVVDVHIGGRSTLTDFLASIDKLRQITYSVRRIDYYLPSPPFASKAHQQDYYEFVGRRVLVGEQEWMARNLAIES